MTRTEALNDALATAPAGSRITKCLALSMHNGARECLEIVLDIPEKNEPVVVYRFCDKEKR